MMSAVKGYCPTQENEFTIEVPYVEIDGFGAEKVYEKVNGFECDYADGDKERCHRIDECPIFKNAPNRLKK